MQEAKVLKIYRTIVMINSKATHIKQSVIDISGYLLVFFLFFLLSLFLSGYYTGGDQEAYQKYYKILSALDFQSGYLAMYNYTGGSEPVYFLFTWIASKIVSKNIVMSFVNAILALFIFRYLKNVRANKIVIFLLFSNFYLWVFFVAAERLKFGILFFMIAACLLQEGKKKYWVFFILSIFSHFQMLIVLCMLVSREIGKKLVIKHDIKFTLRRILFLYVLIPAIAFLIVKTGFFLMPVILDKLEYYFVYGSVYSMLKPIFFLGLTLIYVKKCKTEVIFVNLPLIFAAYFIGSDRLALFSFFTFIHYGLKVRNGINVGVLAISIYFTIKCAIFVYNIFVYGAGFD